MNNNKSLRVSDAKVTLTQEQDSCSASIEDQYLTIEVTDAGAGPYLVLKTDRWAIDIDELQAFIDKLNEVYKLCNQQ